MDPFQKYKSTVLTTGDSVRQLLFVLDEVIKLLHIAKKALGEKDYETKYNTISKITDVFYILRTGVDLENGGEAIRTLDNFYASTIYNLEQANIKAEVPEDLDVILNAIILVRDSIKTEVDNPSGQNNQSN